MPRAARGYGKTPGAPIGAPEECVGYVVLDPLGQKVGSVEEVFVNGNGEPQYIRVTMGWFRRKSVLLPVQFVAVDEERRTLTLG